MKDENSRMQNGKEHKDDARRLKLRHIFSALGHRLKIAIILVGIIVIVLPVLYTVQSSGVENTHISVETGPENRFDRTVRAVGTNTYQPYSFFDEEGNPSGYEVELLYTIANRAGFNVELRLLSWADCAAAVESGEADLTLGKDIMLNTQDNRFAVTTPTCTDNFSLYGRGELESMYALRSGTVGTASDTAYASLLIRPDSLRYYSSTPEMLALAEHGTLDYVLVRRAVASRYLASGIYPHIHDALPHSDGYTSYIGYAALQKNSALIEEINGVLDEMNNDGTLSALQQKWLVKFFDHYTLSELIERDPIAYAAFGTALFVYLLAVAAITWLSYIHTRERTQAEQLRRSSEVIKILTNDYTGLYLFNIKYEQGSLISMSDRIRHDTGNALARTPSLQEAMVNFIQTLVHPDDRAKLAEVAEPEKVRDRLAHKKRDSIIFRRNYDGEYQYTEMTIAKAEEIDEPAENVAIGFTEIDRRYKSEVERQAIIRGLTKDFNLVCCIDPDTMEDQVYRFDERLLAYLPGWNTITNFSDRLRCIEDNIVFPDDCEMFYAATRKSRILSELEKAPAYSVNYRTLIDGAIEYRQIKFIMTDAEPFKLVAGIHSVDDETREQMRIKALLEQNLEIIDILASEYSSVYYIDLETGLLTPYTQNAGTQAGFDAVLDSELGYTEAFRGFVDRFVCDADKADMLRAGSIYNIRRQLATQKAFVTSYRGENDGNTHFCEMKFVKVGGELSEPRAIALAFADKDEETLKHYVDTKLHEDYIGLYYVSLERDRIRTLKWLESDDIGKRSGTRVYSERMRELSRQVMPEYRDYWERMADISQIQSYLGTDDRREYSYRSISGEWHRVTMLVLERRDGVALSFILTFMQIDNITAQYIEMSSMIAEQNRTLEQQQQALEQALQMANAASKAKTVFLNNMSHDIRTPMNAIIGFTGLAEKHIDNSEQVRDYLAKISQSSDHLLSLINDVLDMSRIESGKMNLEEKPESLSDIMQTLRNIVQANARAKQISLSVDAIDVYDENIICDKLRLNQVLLNLLSNAIKYTNDGGAVAVTVTETKVSHSGYGTYEFRVRDNGIGMSEEFLRTIFEPFSRARNEMVYNTQGTGLGMAITKTLVEMMGGSIELHSQENVGTEAVVVFEFRILADERARTAITGTEGMRALVVDSDTDTCRCLSRMLCDLGVRAQWCASGSEAVMRTEDALRSGDGFGFFIIDREMPDMDGLETALALRRAAGTEPPVILIKPSEDWVGVPAEAGISAFINRPLFPSDLRHVLGRCFGESEAEAVPADTGCRFSGKRILLVEDNELNREIAVEILTDSSFLIDSAENGAIAVEKIRGSEPGTYDIVLMDVQMPVMDGYEATKAIRALEDPALAQIPIIAMTANAFEEDRRAALAAGMDAHIAKPINIEKLRETLQRFV